MGVNDPLNLIFMPDAKKGVGSGWVVLQSQPSRNLARNTFNEFDPLPSMAVVAVAVVVGSGKINA